MKISKFFIIAVLFVIPAFANLCFAQSQASENLLNDSELKYFNRQADGKSSEFLFKTLYYVAPYRKSYYVLTVSKDGKLMRCRTAPDWAIQGTQRAELNEEQLKELKNLISEISIQEGHSAFLTPQKGEKHTAFIYLNGENQKRMDFIGELPFDIERVVSFADKVLKENNSIYTSETKEEN